MDNAFSAEITFFSPAKGPMPNGGDFLGYLPENILLCGINLI
jgi:hypothetical protein